MSIIAIRRYTLEGTIARGTKRYQRKCATREEAIERARKWFRLEDVKAVWVYDGDETVIELGPEDKALIDPNATIVLVVRHPDFENEVSEFGPARLLTYDIDYGRSNLSNPDEYADWSESHMRDVAKLRMAGHDDAADAYEEAIRNGEGRPMTRAEIEKLCHDEGIGIMAQVYDIILNREEATEEQMGEWFGRLERHPMGDYEEFVVKGINRLSDEIQAQTGREPDPGKLRSEVATASDEDLARIATVMRDALEGESNDQEHDALTEVAEFLGVHWNPDAAE